jgi:hypothetical protein
MLKPQPILMVRVRAEVKGQHQNVGDALVALPLEVVLGQPEGVIAGPSAGR